MLRPTAAAISPVVLALSLVIWPALSPVFAETVVLSDLPYDVSVAAVEEDGGATRIECVVARFELAPVTIDGNVYYEVSLGDESRSKQKGLPAVPTVNRGIAIPDDAEMELRVVSSHYVEFPDTPVAPSKGLILRDTDPDQVPYTFDEFYAEGGRYPESTAVCGEPYIMRDVRGTLLTVNPFSYDASERTLRVYDSIVVELRPKGPGKKNVLDFRPAVVDREFERMYRDRFLNYEVYAAGSDAVRRATEGYPSPGERGGMLVVCYDDFVSAVEPLAEWKKQTGLPCEIVSVTDAGGSASAIASLIETRYYSDGISYVLLVGDYLEAPTDYANAAASDPSYALIAGDDWYPDVFVGRFSAESVADVETQVERTIEYERDPDPPATWYGVGTGIASTKGPGDDLEYDDEHIDLIRDDLLAFTYTHVDQMYYPYATSSGVAEALNVGRGIINYAGHGSYVSWSTSGFSSTHVNALTNDSRLPFIFSVACFNGGFTGRTCFGESWLRATNEGEPTGAIGAYMSSVGQSWDPPMDAQDEFVDLLVAGERETYGGLCYGGSGHMMDEYPLGGPPEFLAWHIFGDPSLKVRTDTPHDISVTHAGEVEPSSLTFDVSVTGVEGALCALYSNGVLHGAGVSDDGGNAVIEIDEPLPADSDVTITVTAQNAIPYVATITVPAAHVPILDLDRDSVDVELTPGSSASDSLTVMNVGDPLSTLDYAVTVVDRSEPLNRTDWHVSVSPDTFTVDGMFDLTFTVENASSDSAVIDAVSLDFPAGAVPFTATDLVSAADTLVWDGANGDGAKLTWTGAVGHELPPGASATTVVSMLVSASFAGDLCVVYSMSGSGAESTTRSGSVSVGGPGGAMLVITSPAANDFLRAGETHKIEWTTGGPVDEVALDYTFDGGATWVAFASGLANTGSYEWSVPNLSSANCLIRITSTEGVTAEAASADAFVIYRPVSWLELSADEGSVSYGESDTVVLTVDASGLSEAVHEADIVFTGQAIPRQTVPVRLTVESLAPPDRLALYGNYPNPFTLGTDVAFALPAQARVTVRIYDVAGRLVRTVVDTVYDEGQHAEPWDGRDTAGEKVAAGVYFCRVESDGASRTSKMLLIR